MPKKEQVAEAVKLYYLVIDHIPESLEVSASYFLLACLEFTMINKTRELSKPLTH